MKYDLKELKMSLSEAIFIAKEHDEIILDDKIYYEKIELETPYITLRGRKNSVITYDAYASKLIHGTDKKYGTTGSTTFRVMPSAHHFQAFDLTFENSHIRIQDGNGHQAVAFKSETSNIYIKNCKFKSYQDTLYIDNGTNNLITDSEIEGDIDFIFGSADCVFNNCIISAKSDFDMSYYIAPSTYAINMYGFIFNNCKFNQLNKLKTILGRRWYPSGAISPVLPRAEFINCDFNGDIDMDMITMHEGDPIYMVYSRSNVTLNGEKLEDLGKVNSNYANKIVNKYNA